jgi:hypothetical protein
MSPAPTMRQVAFGRLNRRLPDQQSFARRPFAEDMRALAESRQTRAEIDEREWVAADLALDISGDFMTGVLGYAESELRRDFEDDAFSWIKGRTSMAEGASRRTTVPFAVDLREDRRWVAFAPSGRIQAASFRRGFAAVLNAAVSRLELWPSEWEFDLVLQKRTVEEWIAEHDEVFYFRRKVKLTNPGREIDEDRSEMRALAARSKEEIFKASYGRTLRLEDSEEFSRKLDGVETGDLEVYLRARGPEGTEFVFKSEDQPERTFVADFEDNLEEGVDRVLDALREYSERRAASPS